MGDNWEITRIFTPRSHFSGEEVFGRYQINVTDRDESVWQINTTFDIIHLDVFLHPERDVYAQGSPIDIRVETDLTEPFKVNITDADGNPVADAEWTATAVDGNWTTNYTLVENMADGTYYINVVQDAHLLKSVQIEVKKYTLHIFTDKEAYLPGEDIKVFYSVTSNRDGSKIVADIEWLMSVSYTHLTLPTKA